MIWSKNSGKIWWLGRIFWIIMDISKDMWYGVENTNISGSNMKGITTIIALLMFLTGCGKSRSSADTSVVTSKYRNAIIIATSTAKTTLTQPTTTTANKKVKIETAEETQPISTAETAEIPFQTHNTTETVLPPFTTVPAESTETVIVTQQSSTDTTVYSALVTEITETKTVTETITESESTAIIVITDYEKAKEVYEYIRQNGYGTCVNYACQTYDKCCDIGLQCFLVWTNAGIYGHVADIVNVDGVWYVLDTQGGRFLDYNYGFTEVINDEGEHIADADIISDHSYDELH